jgi:predicted amidophosphoribosyltransferase
MGEKAKIKKVVVSDLFMDCYKHFNVYSQVERMNELSQRELYLLLILCLDKHDDENTVVKHNFIPFEKQIMEIFDVQDDKEVTNQVLLDLVTETGDTYIETENIVDGSGNKVADVFTKEEVRDIRIDLIDDEKEVE